MVNRLERLAASTSGTEGKGQRGRVQRAEPSLDLAAPAQVCSWHPRAIPQSITGMVGTEGARECAGKTGKEQVVKVHYDE
jgi:hypothetical protein